MRWPRSSRCHLRSGGCHSNGCPVRNPTSGRTRKGDGVTPAEAEAEAEKSIMRETLQNWARVRGYYLHASDSSQVIVLAKASPQIIDIAHIRGPASAAAARLVNDRQANIWRPFSIVTHYYGDYVRAMEFLELLADTDTATLNKHPYTPPNRSSDGVNPLYVTDSERAKMKVHRPITDRSSTEARRGR
jgi:hypothetical protein